MDDHLGILEEWVETEAILRDRAGYKSKWRCGEVEQEQKEDLHPGEDGRGIGGEFDVYLMPDTQDEPIGGKQPGPEEQ